MSELTKFLTNFFEKRYKGDLPKVYEPMFENYYRAYLKHLGVKPKSIKNATDMLNRDYFSSVIGSRLPIKSDRSIRKAYDVFTDAYAYVELAILRKYKVDSFKDLKKVSAAKSECDALESWKRNAEGEFRKRAYALHQANQARLSPDAFMSSSIALMLPILVGFGGAIAGAIPSIAKDDIESSATPTIIFGAIVGGALGCGLAVLQDKVINPNSYVVDFGFANKQELYSYMAEYLKVLPQEEKVALINEMVDNYKLTLAHENGFSSVDEAMQVAQQGAKDVEITLQQALTENSTTFDYARQNLANRYGLSSYEDAINYLNIHKILTGKTNGKAEWSEYSYDIPEAKAMAIEINKLDQFQARQITELKSQTWPQVVTDYGKYQDMMLKIDSLDNFNNNLNAEALSNIEYAFGVDNVANVVYSELADKYGAGRVNDEAGIKHIETILEKVGASLGSNNDVIQNGEVVGNVDDMISTISASGDALVGAGIAGMSLGGVVGALARFSPFVIRDAVKRFRASRAAERTKPIEKLTKKITNKSVKNGIKEVDVAGKKKKSTSSIDKEKGIRR